MAYKPIHNYRQKDRLKPGDPDKIIYGSNLQDDFDAISGEINSLESKVDNIDGGGGAGSGSSSWDDITGRPDEFPPKAHMHQQSEVNGLEVRLDAIEDAITDGGSFVDAPDDGKLYGRQSEDWVEIDIDVDLTDYYTKSQADIAFASAVHIHTEYASLGHTHNYAEVNHTHSEYQPKGNYLTSESDPTVPPHVKSITQSDISNWNSNAGGGGNDPRITDTQINNWNTAYGWGNHASQGYLKSANLNGYATQGWVSQNYQTKGTYLTSESDPTVPPHVKSISSADIAKWNSASGGGTGNFQDDIIVNGSGESPTILLKAGWPRGPEIQWAYANSPAGPQHKYMRLNSTGGLEIVSTSYSAVIFTFDDDGTLHCKTVIESSDASLKSNIRTAPKSIVSQLIGREWEDKETGAKCSGVVAQEVEEVVPHLVDTDKEGVKGVKYSGLIAYLIEEVKSLREEVEALKA